MAEEKKKTTNTKEVVKKEETKKAPELKKEKLKVVKSEVAKKPTTKKEPKATTAKNTKKVEKKPTKKVEQLDRTMIFDGEQKRNLQEVVDKLEKENIVLKDKVVKRSKLKRVIVLILIALIAAGFIYIGIYLGTNLKRNMTPPKEEEKVPTLNTNIYDKVNQYREEIKDKETNKKPVQKGNVRTISLREFENKILAKEDINVIVSSNTCYFCMTFEPTVEKVLKDTKKIIYRIDISELEQKDIDKFREYYAFTITPTIFVVKDGVVVSEKIGTMEEANFKNWAIENLV